ENGIEGLVEAVKRINSLKNAEYLQLRQKSRLHVENNFTIERMVEKYEKVYQEVINKNKIAKHNS
ncbi:MAG TPA: hypothetical protein VK338_00540, partial [Candidatus Nitrosocosmicus sp.]|nr:hypothetical protein [Candidatus Nitrosocosmicus sp.]